MNDKFSNGGVIPSDLADLYDRTEEAARAVRVLRDWSRRTSDATQRHRVRGQLRAAEKILARLQRRMDANGMTLVARDTERTPGRPGKE